MHSWLKPRHNMPKKIFLCFSDIHYSFEKHPKGYWTDSQDREQRSVEQSYATVWDPPNVAGKEMKCIDSSLTVQATAFC